MDAGRKHGLLSVLGNGLGALPLVVAVALGVGAVIAESVVIFTTVKLLGAAYLTYLVGGTNPKTIVLFAAALPQFVDPRAGTISTRMIVLGLVFIFVALFTDSIWAIAAGSAGAWFASSPGRLSGVRATGGAMMIGLGGTLALTGHTS